MIVILILVLLILTFHLTFCMHLQQLEEMQDLQERASATMEATIPLEKQAKLSDDDVSPRNEGEPLSEASKKPEPKSSTKKSSRFFSASFFSTDDDSEFTPSMVFSELATVVKAQLGKVVIGAALLLAG